MARMPRLAVAGWPHFVVQRVHEGHALVRDQSDVDDLHAALREAAREHQVTVHAYVVGDAELYLLATPARDDGISKCMQALGRRYVAGYNRRHARSGGLWAGRYRSTIIEPAQHLLDCTVFIETHAIRSGLVRGVEEDRRSSAGHHLGLRSDPLIQDHALFWALGNTPFEREAVWRRKFEWGLSDQDVRRLSEAVNAGWALGGPEFLRTLAHLAGRRVEPRPRGRPARAPTVKPLA